MIEITAGQLIAHAVGDYLLQSHWMATEKTKRWGAAIVHALIYSLPFLVFAPTLWAWLAIVGSHALIDRFRLARYVVWAKNFLGPVVLARRGEPEGFCDHEYNAPDGYWGGEYPLFCFVNRPWSECKATGYPADVPPWLSVWLLIIADNVLHVLCNALALGLL